MATFTFTREEIQNMSFEEIEKFKGCLFKFKISGYVFPEGVMKRSYGIVGGDEYEFYPLEDRYYLFEELNKFNSGIYSSCIATFNSLIPNSDNYHQIWMLNIEQGGIVNSLRQPNSYNILSIEIYSYITPEIYSILPEKYLLIYEQKKEEVKSSKELGMLPDDILDIIIKYYITIADVVNGHYK
jgi:hypothetical protein